MDFQSAEPGSPEPLVGIDPLGRVPKGAGVQPAAADPAFLLPDDETGIFKDPEMLHDRRQGNIERLGQYRGRCFSLSQAGQDGPPRWIGQGLECLI